MLKPSSLDVQLVLSRPFLCLEGRTQLRTLAMGVQSWMCIVVVSTLPLLEGRTQLCTLILSKVMVGVVIAGVSNLLAGGSNSALHLAMILLQ